MATSLDRRLPVSYDMGHQYQNIRGSSQSPSRHTNMASIPRIDLYSPPESVPLCYGTVSPPTTRAPLEPPVSIFSSNYEKTIKKSKSDNGMRKSFWSKLKKNRSENHRHSHSDMLTRTYTRSDPRQAKSGGRLIWSNEHHMWMFPAVETSDDEQLSSPWQWWPTREHERRHTTTMTRIANDSDELLFAQIPGHYTLSPYDSVNNDDLLPTYTTGRNFGDVATRKGTESQWTLVAKRVSGSASVH
ncbi:hypothetical protein GX51_00149 [Blastomyces parvus]|uniref:Uncharacterized protein n=1 Tax=Blastomyces parvus TaxID=2060905 RepID=A0A2B7XNQ2_9EURO|nr:hypothetical protein GX51_00149 [Blastomyces parvus]